MTRPTTRLSSELRRVLANMGWLGAGRVLQALVAFAVGAWVARHLGPDHYGLFAFVLAWVTLFFSVVRIGANTVLVRDFVTQPANAGTAFASVLVLRIVIALPVMVAAILAALWSESSRVVIMLIAVLAVAQCIKATDVAEFWFQSQVKSKYTVWANAIAICITASLRVVLILLGAGVEAFVWAMAVEWVLQTALMYLALVRFGRLPLSRLRPSVAYARQYLKDAWPLVISGMASTIYLRIDQVMLERLGDLVEVGQYAVASSLVQTGFFAPNMICASLFPALLRARQRDAGDYQRRLVGLFALLVWLGLAAAVCATIAADFVVPLVFGAQFASAAPMFAVAAWSWVFAFFMIATGQHLVAENLALVVMVRTLLGAASNVALNALLIPSQGGLGAAWATLLSFAIASLVGNLLFQRSRGVTTLFFKALDPRRLQSGLGARG